MPKFTYTRDTFSGPLDLLLELIQERKMHISEVSIASVTDRFLEYVNSCGEFPIGESANFLLVASTLMLIKSRSLLPGLELTQDEETDVAELENRLKLYEIYKKASRELGEHFGHGTMRLPLRRAKVICFAPPPLSDFNLAGLKNLVTQIIMAIPAIASLPRATIRKIQSLEELMAGLLQRVMSGLSLKFSETHKSLAGTAGERQQVIVASFLALLELIRRGKVSVSQTGTFHDIIIEPNEIGAPRYG